MQMSARYSGVYRLADKRPKLTVQALVTIVAGRRFIGLPVPLNFLFIGWAAIIVGWFWFGRLGTFRLAARRGGWWLAAGVLASLSMMAFAVGVATGHLVIGVAALLAGTPIAPFMAFRLYRDSQQSE